MNNPLSGDVTLPGVGPVKKVVVVGVVGVGAAYVGWRYYQARSDAGADTTPSDANADATDEDTLTGTDDGMGGYSNQSTGDTSTSDDGTVDSSNQITTNAQWTQFAASQLSASDTWSYTDVVTALGNYLGGRPLSSLQQQIVSAAVAVAGSPPSGYFSIIPGGETKITVAPAGLKVASKTATTVTLTFEAVPGAASYRAYSSTSSTNVGSSSGTSITVGNLTPAKKYTFHVRAVSAAGTTGPNSGNVSATTAGITLAKPHKPTVTAIAKTSAHLSTNTIKGADGYNWYINGTSHGHSDGPAYTVTGLAPKTAYKATVRADTSTGSPGPSSLTADFKTKA